jgi:hypothetical protein
MVDKRAYQTEGSAGLVSDEKERPQHARFGALVGRHFATGVWILLLGLLTRQVLVYGTHVPFTDDWIFIGELWPDGKLDLATLWRAHNEHRIPLAKLAWLATVRGLHDARAGTFLTVILMAGSAWLCLRTAKKLRGRAHFTDAFFPLVLMHGGQCENVLNSFQLAFSIPAAAILLGLTLIVTSNERPGPRTIVAIGCLALSMPLMGGCGLPHGVAWIGWLLLVFTASRRSRASNERRTGRIALAFAIMTASLTAWYFVDYHLAPNFAPAPPDRLVETALQFLSRGIGEPALTLQPWGSWTVLALFLRTAGLLVWISSQSDIHQARAIGIAVVLAGMVGTATAIGYGRGMDGPFSGLLDRYGLISAPLWCAFFFAAVLAWERAAGRALGIVLFLCAAASFVPNFIAGEREGSARRAKAEALESDLEEGTPIEEIAANRWRDFFYSPELFALALHDLEATHMKPFDGAAYRHARAPFGALRSEPLPTVAAGDVQEREANGKRVLLVRDGAVLEFALGPRPVEVRGVCGIHPQLVGLAFAPSARFTIELRRADGTRAVLFELTLDPRSAAPAEAERKFDLLFDASAANGTIALSITLHGETQTPWAGYWRDVFVH